MKKKAKVLIVDDEPIVRESLRDWLRDVGYDVLTAEAGSKALGIVEEESPDIVFTDLVMPGMDGLELLKRVKDICPATEVVVITAYGSIPTAIAATREGAFDYVEKPFSPEKAELLIEKVVERRCLIEEIAQLRQKSGRRYPPESIIAKSAKIKKVIDLIRIAAKADVPVLITGESGTGKELVAQTIHSRSYRKDKPFVAVSCAASSENVLESELFGYEKCAFTGAYAQQRGKFEIAKGGTLFLDDISEMTPSSQIHLLRLLEQNEFTRVGGNHLIQVDARIISATGKDIKQMVADGQFRQELYYRLNMFTIDVPPLRERKEDIPLLAQFFLKKFAAQYHKEVASFSTEATRSLLKYDWPGNVRELQNVVGRAVILAKSSRIDVTDLHQENRIRVGSPQWGETLEELEKNHILNVLTRAQGNYRQAARILGISRTTLYNKARAYGLNVKNMGNNLVK